MIRLNNLLLEEETFTATNKKSGKTSVFKSKDSRDAAVKSGTHDAKKDSSKKDEPTKPTTPKVNIFDKPKPAGDGMDTVKSIASKTGLRTTAVAGWADENGVNLAKVSAAIISKKLKPMDLMTAISGKPGNKYAKDIVAKYSTKPEPVDKGGPKTLGMKKKSFFGNDTEDGPDPVDTSPKPDRFGDKFELGTPAVYTDNGKEYSGEVVMNPSNQRVQIDGKFVTIGKGSTKGIQVYGSDTFIVPDDWNDAKGFNDATEKPTEQPKQPRKGNPQVNIATKKAAESAGITPQKLGGEYKDTMYKAAVEALTDSNYHDEARALVAKLEGKPEWAKKVEYPSMDDPDYRKKMNALKTTGVDSSEYWKIDDTTRKFAIGVSQESSYDGASAADGIAFTLKMNGFHKEAEMIQSVLQESKSTRLTSLLKEALIQTKKK